jgi:hypothetical protein
MAWGCRLCRHVRDFAEVGSEVGDDDNCDGDQVSALRETVDAKTAEIAALQQQVCPWL